ncbi:MAG: hypothetical protein B7Y26_03620 [Hydrogenophilales bacterium 16-64-46]|nr:MAG: hypothetical protein B7Z32_03320 [Hydrogenophilales bacterium 12-64-13]OYZ06882.1 MAG: hypothetical protein B7Y26_03620 [Hydrogenophilales bacterium 16-64-46]OZA37026.1 MAG: hypothetical protein B7X87_12015 [Hydrogenophilales bacterium 17-64-34]HQS99910.1 hypothetical protein [Thiobacillus sp.]
MSKKSLIAAAVGTAFVAGMSAAPIAAAAENPFALSGLSSGYQVADGHMGKTKEGKCGEGKCGGMKAGEGKCGISMADANKDGKVSKEEAGKMHEAMFSSMDANKDGFVDKAEMGKMMDGKCGEGKCGGMKK